MVRQETGELVDIDKLVLSSPTNNNHELLPLGSQVFQPNFEREASQKAVRVSDKAV